MPNLAMVAFGHRLSSVSTLDGATLERGFAPKAPLEANALCQLPEGGLCAVGHHRELISAIGVFDGEEWHEVGRQDLPGTFNGLYGVASNSHGLFVSGTQFGTERAVLRRDGERWVAERVPFGNGIMKLVASDTDVFGLVLKPGGGLGSGYAIAQRGEGAWREVPKFTGQSVSDIAVIGDALFAVGDLGQVHHRVNGVWKTEPIFAQARALFVAGTAPDDVWVGGKTKTELYFAHYDG